MHSPYIDSINLNVRFSGFKNLSVQFGVLHNDNTSSTYKVSSSNVPPDGKTFNNVKVYDKDLAIGRAGDIYIYFDVFTLEHSSGNQKTQKISLFVAKQSKGILADSSTTVKIQDLFLFCNLDPVLLTTRSQ